MISTAKQAISIKLAKTVGHCLRDLDFETFICLDHLVLFFYLISLDHLIILCVRSYSFEVHRTFSREGSCEKITYSHVLSRGKTHEQHYGQL